MPSTPVSRPMESAHNFQNQLPLVRTRAGNTESVFHKLGCVVEAFFIGVVEAAEHAAGVHFFADLDFENHAHGGIDWIFFACAACAHHLRGASDIFGHDRAHKT